MSEERIRPDDDLPVYAISVASQIAGLHPQTLRQYDRLGLVSPDRTGGRNRLYSLRDIIRLREVSRLSAEGVNLAGIQRILTLETENERLRSQLGLLLAEKLLFGEFRSLDARALRPERFAEGEPVAGSAVL